MTTTHHRLNKRNLARGRYYADDALESPLSWARSVVNPWKGPAYIPDTDFTSVVLKQVRINKTMLFGNSDLFLLFTPLSNGPVLRLFKKGTHPEYGVGYYFSEEITPDQDLADDFLIFRASAAGLKTKSATISAGNFAVAGTFNAACYQSLPDLRLITPETVLATARNEYDRIAVVSSEEGVVTLMPPDGRYEFKPAADETNLTLEDTLVVKGSAQCFPAPGSVVNDGFDLYDTYSPTTPIRDIPTNCFGKLKINMWFQLSVATASQRVQLSVYTKRARLAPDGTWHNAAGVITMSALATNTGHVTLEKDFFVEANGDRDGPLMRVEVVNTSGTPVTLNAAGVRYYCYDRDRHGYLEPGTIITASGMDASQQLTIDGVVNYEAVPNATLVKNLPTGDRDATVLQLDLAESFLARRNSFGIPFVTTCRKFDYSDSLSVVTPQNMAAGFSDVMRSLMRFAPIAGTALGGMLGDPGTGGMLGGVVKDVGETLFSHGAFDDILDMDGGGKPQHLFLADNIGSKAELDQYKARTKTNIAEMEGVIPYKNPPAVSSALTLQLATARLATLDPRQNKGIAVNRFPVIKSGEEPTAALIHVFVVTDIMEPRPEERPVDFTASFDEGTPSLIRVLPGGASIGNSSIYSIAWAVLAAGVPKCTVILGRSEFPISGTSLGLAVYASALGLPFTYGVLSGSILPDGRLIPINEDTLAMKKGVVPSNSTFIYTGDSAVTLQPNLYLPSTTDVVPISEWGQLVLMYAYCTEPRGGHKLVDLGTRRYRTQAPGGTGEMVEHEELYIPGKAASRVPDLNSLSPSEPVGKQAVLDTQETVSFTNPAGGAAVSYTGPIGGIYKTLKEIAKMTDHGPMYVEIGGEPRPVSNYRPFKEHEYEGPYEVPINSIDSAIAVAKSHVQIRKVAVRIANELTRAWSYGYKLLKREAGRQNTADNLAKQALGARKKGAGRVVDYSSAFGYLSQTPKQSSPPAVVSKQEEDMDKYF